MPTFEVSIQIDGKLKKVKDVDGVQMGMPEVIRRLEESVDRTANTTRWILGNN